MPKKEKFQIPEVRDEKAGVSAAGKQALDKATTFDFSQMTAEDLLWNNPEAEVVRGNQYAADAWVHGPANVQLMASSHKQLLKLAGVGVTRVDKVRMALIRGTKFLLIKPTAATDPDGIEVNSYRSSIWVNAITVLGPEKMTIKTSFRDRFTVETTPEGFLGGPGLLINLGKRLERRTEGKNKAPGTATPAAGKSTKSRAKRNQPTDTPVTPMSEPGAADI